MSFLLNKNKKTVSRNGYSLIEILIAMSVLGGSALGVVQLGKFASDHKARTTAKEGHLNLKKRVRLLVTNKDACEATFAGMTFKGGQLPIVPTPKTDLDPFNKPLHGIKLKYQRNDGSPGDPAISHDPNDKTLEGKPVNQFGRVQVKGIEIIMPENTGKIDLPDTDGSYKSYPFEVLTHTVSEIEPDKFIDNALIRNRVYLTVKTDSAGDSEVIGCRNNSLAEKKVFTAEFNSPVSDVLLTDGTRDKFIFCGLTKQYHRPDDQNWLSNKTAISSFYRCRLEPSGVGPYHSWRFSLENSNGDTECEVVCI